MDHLKGYGKTLGHDERCVKGYLWISKQAASRLFQDRAQHISLSMTVFGAQKFNAIYNQLNVERYVIEGVFLTNSMRRKSIPPEVNFDAVCRSLKEPHELICE